MHPFPGTERISNSRSPCWIIKPGATVVFSDMVEAGCAGAGESDRIIYSIAAGQETIVVPAVKSVVLILLDSIVTYSRNAVDSKRNAWAICVYRIRRSLIHPGEIGPDFTCFLRIEVRFDPH